MQKKYPAKSASGEFSFETGKLAGQASAAVLARVGRHRGFGHGHNGRKSQGRYRFFPAVDGLRREALRGREN